MHTYKNMPMTLGHHINKEKYGHDQAGTQTQVLLIMRRSALDEYDLIQVLFN